MLMNSNELLQQMTVALTDQPIDHVVKDFTTLLSKHAHDAFAKTVNKKQKKKTSS